MEWEMKMCRGADLIAQGASNPSGVARTLVEMIDTAREQGLTHDAIRSHPAMRVVIGHLAFLFGEGPGPSIEALDAVKEVVDMDAILDSCRIILQQARSEQRL